MIPISCTITSSEVIDDQFKQLSITFETEYDCFSSVAEAIIFAPLTDDLIEWNLERCRGLQVVYDAVSAHRAENWTEQFRDSYRDYIIENAVAAPTPYIIDEDGNFVEVEDRHPE